MAELYREYKKYQAGLLSLYPRLRTVYDNILQVVDEEHVEVHVPSHCRKVSEGWLMVDWLIDLLVDLMIDWRID